MIRDRPNISKKVTYKQNFPTRTGDITMLAYFSKGVEHMYDAVPVCHGLHLRYSVLVFLGGGLNNPG